MRVPIKAKLNQYMKNYLILFIFFIVLTSCDKKNKTEKAIENIPISIDVDRFDQAFFETKPEDLQTLKNKYPYFFSSNDDAAWKERMTDPQWRDLYNEVQKKYKNFDSESASIAELLKHIKFYFPETKANPKIITVIGDMDNDMKAIYTDSLLIVSLELYLGKDHKYYDYPAYIKKNFEAEQIVSDLAQDFAERKIAPPHDKTLLSQMIYNGKILYLKDLLIPSATDAQKIGYTSEEIVWSEENENYMWRYFIENKLLFDTSSKLANRFINPAPFSKFYLEIDNETPGSVGRWIGWQIVRSYAKNNDVSLETLLQTDSKEIFDNSKYKPRKE